MREVLEKLIIKFAWPYVRLLRARGPAENDKIQTGSTVQYYHGNGQKVNEHN